MVLFDIVMDTARSSVECRWDCWGTFDEVVVWLGLLLVVWGASFGRVCVVVLADVFNDHGRASQKMETQLTIFKKSLKNE